MKSLNKVQLIGNLTRDPELKYTPTGTAVCTFSIATNRQWTTDQGEKKDEADFHRCVAWNKLAEICSNLLKKGRKVYVEGRLQTRSWQAQDGQTKYTTEIVISDMILLDSKGGGDGDVAVSTEEYNVPDEFDVNQDVAAKSEKAVKPAKKSKEEPKAEVAEDDIPF
jgi:single-strand DNA-binding protein